MGANAGIMTDALAWAGRFTASARGYCAKYAEQNRSRSRLAPFTTAKIPPT